ncbi:MAG: hypothetical protein ACQEXJ_15165 [Myxococcota bacterium]
MKRLVLCTIAALPTLIAVDAVQAAERETWEYAWTRTHAGEVVGEEKAKQVRTERARYLSGEVAPAAEDEARLLTHAQQTPTGELFKYWRKKDVRQGPELRAFRRDDLLRIVGIHMEREPAEIPGGPTRALWDPEAWHSIATWLHRLEGPEGAEVPVPWVDVQRATTGTARAVRETGRRAMDADGGEHPLHVWRVEGLLPGVMRIYVDAEGRLVGAEGGETGLLRAGWTWAPGAEESEVPGPEILKVPEAAGESDREAADPDAIGDDGDAAPSEEPPEPAEKSEDAGEEEVGPSEEPPDPAEEGDMPEDAKEGP